MTVENLKTETASLLSKYEPNEWLKIMRESSTVEEGITATYIRAMQPDCFNHYRWIRDPFPPQGWHQSHEVYLKVSGKGSEKSEAWRKLEEKYSGYIKACDGVRAANRSNKKFLEDMKAHFEKLGMLSYKQIVEERLQEFS